MLSESESPFRECDRIVTASRRLLQAPLQECYRSHRFKNVTHRFQKVTAATASSILPQTIRPQSPLQVLTVLRRLPQSRLQECCRSRRCKNVLRSQLQGRYRSHRFKKVTEVIVSRMRPQSPLHECDRSHSFKSATAVTASRMSPRSPLQECYTGHCYTIVTGVAASRILPQSCKNVTAVTASSRLP